MRFNLSSPLVLLPGLGLLVFLVFMQGLDSRFLLDDIHNLRGLAEINETGVLKYLASGDAGPTGRPIAYLSFALQHESWPIDPSAFKLVNLLIHILNGALLFLICALLANKSGVTKKEKYIICLFATSLWLVHPMQTSTVFYVVQRMTLLSSLFILAGIAGYLVFRERFLLKGKIKYLVLGICHVYVFTGLATLSKEIGVLLPLYILVLEYSLLQGNTPADSNMNKVRGFLWLPVFIVVGYMIVNFSAINAGYHLREFSMSERLITQPLVLLDYIKAIVIPVTSDFSLYHDDYQASKGLLIPPLTLLANVAVAIALLFAIIKCKKYRIVSFAILWFMSGHLLEGSILGLELYYEHRNYLPLFGYTFLIAVSGVYLFRYIKPNVLVYGSMTAYLLFCTVVTFTIADLWSKPYVQAAEWARTHPGSRRALTELWNMHLIYGEPEKAEHVYKQLRQLDSTDIFPALRKIYAHNCMLKQSLDQDTWQELFDVASSADYRGTSSIAEFDNIFYQMGRQKCIADDLEELYTLIRRLIDNPEFNSKRGQLHEFATTAAVLNGKLDAALEEISAALAYDNSVANQVYKLRILAALNKIDEARELLTAINTTLSTTPKRKLYYQEILTKIEQSINTTTTLK